jgi:hypothetical protein
MKNGICPRCNSETVHVSQDGIGELAQLKVYTGGMVTSGCTTLAFVCTTCGFFEVYLHDGRKLQEVAQKWNKVPAQKAN